MSCTFSSCMFRASCKMYTLNMYFLMKYCLLFSSSKSGILNLEQLLVKILHETCTTKKCTTSKNLIYLSIKWRQKYKCKTCTMYLLPTLAQPIFAHVFVRCPRCSRGLQHDKAVSLSFYPRQTEDRTLLLITGIEIVRIIHV